MEIKEITTDDSITHLALKGRLDLKGVEQVELKFTTLVAAKPRPSLIDLSELEFIASLGLRMFLSCVKTLKNKNAQMVLLKPTQHVLDILTSVGFDKLIPIENDLDKAIEILKQEP
ncbi:MAG: STAS domain-containing protein [Candidatus Dadabacteria bacterium]|nr:STAS domain-containing protein [Candidatus Dadabacteria bacterium]NIS10215.1 STAS domain-containing protein [Candidatus Dadabacteria bacterium]NIV42660.1 anti-sigma factor antagonist [Candidatus Dadabacteria bacterium]NIX16583.1 anti-sigma factor antagonist [Candidatus Dadabacteria bacterium]NIY23130.1 anti-sigma factor antagonist [Candidatus Dadabacteria bacterium]